MPKQCSSPDCSNPVFSKGLCTYHWRGVHLKPIKNTTPLRASNKPIRKVSKKQSKINVAYSALRSAYLKSNPSCKAMVVCSGVEATDIHHIKSRGEFMLDTTTWMSVCRNCHQWIHDNHAAAKEKGLIKSKLNNPHPFIIKNWKERYENRNSD